MKKIHFILIPLVFFGFILGKVFTPDTEDKKQISTEFSQDKASQNDAGRFHDNSLLRVTQKLNCKSCHESEYPTKDYPGLLSCPRSDMISVYHSPEEGPEFVKIDEMSDYYNGVEFSHKVHAEMSEMSGGCTGCHHYNTTGPVLNCRKCHESSRSREDVSIPDLKAAYHRQCTNCHKQWSNENGCSNQCHTPKGSDVSLVSSSVKSKTHPVLTLPAKLVWETGAKTNKIVTFFHNEHVEIFGLECKSCHNQESCIKCHTVERNIDPAKLTRRDRSIEEHHKPCANCHMGNSCQKCHRDRELSPFDHSRSGGWVLKSYHSSIACEKCHGTAMPYIRTGHKCISCHKKFSEEFDHKLAGFTFSEGHTGLECKNCHPDGDFTKTPVCTDCHDDKSFPQDLPGTRK
ncbi:MAG TPA: cytochrome c3 family protein [Ignavibacteria bacterium]|nr:cytochrome c3 family protein [Ignavibacteria bacterium]HMQ99097.1 cytochrome c3 family protein [Ignavibacteria bacterium]